MWKNFLRPNPFKETRELLVFILFLEPFSVCFGNCSWKESIFWVLFLFLRPFSFRFGSFWNKSVCFGCFKIHSKRRNKPKQNFHWFWKWTEANAKQILFRLFSVRTEFFFIRFVDTLLTHYLFLRLLISKPLKMDLSQVCYFYFATFLNLLLPS